MDTKKNACEFPKFNADQGEIKEILEKYKTIAVIGLSQKRDRPSNMVGQYMKEHGYKIIPVNPGQDKLIGEKCYAKLSDVPEDVDIVDIFRQSQYVPEIVEQAITKKCKVIWMQQGIVNNQAADSAKAAGMIVVMDKCIKIEHMGRK
ncbi:CoA-binding protein [Elusimicrobiota bacterium]